MNVFVTGCAGFIGSHLCERLVADGCTVRGVDNFDEFYCRERKVQNLSGLLQHPSFDFYEADIREAAQLDNIHFKPDVVIHLAAKAGVRPSINDPLGYVTTNIDGTLNILRWMMKNKIDKLLFASSSSVYGDKTLAPYREDSITDFAISPYAFTKKAGELLLYTYYHLYQISSVALRFFTVYGPRQRPDLAINKFFDAIRNGTPIALYGDGSTSRDYTYVDDIVDGIMGAINYVKAADNPVCEIVNLGNNVPVTLNDLVAQIEMTCGKKALIRQEGMQQGDVLHTCADISKAQSLLHYRPKVKLADGLQAFYEWKCIVSELETIS